MLINEARIRRLAEQRLKKMKKMRKTMTLAEIGAIFGISRQRAHQILKKGDLNV